VVTAARHAFFDSRVHHAPSRSGLLLYVSLLEHEALILADQQVLKVLGQDKLNALCLELVNELKRGSRVADALCRAIAQAGDLLAGALPAPESNPNELPDALVILDRRL
jgi:putative membrane protein